MHEPRPHHADSAEIDPRASYYANVVTRCRNNYPTAEPTSVDLILHLMYASDVIETRMTRTLSSHGLSLSAYNLLSILRHSDALELPLHNLSELLLVSRANVTGLVDSLEKGGLVERRVDPRDRRVRIARITEEGFRRLDSARQPHLENVKQLCAGLNTEERVTLRALLEKLRASAQQGARP